MSYTIYQIVKKHYKTNIYLAYTIKYKLDQPGNIFR
ncbi:hypothetical protein M2326_002469 [Flavobacterium sp. 7A]|nr:hypothetical protein [Flavobacterium sp. 7A]